MSLAQAAGARAEMATEEGEMKRSEEGEEEEYLVSSMDDMRFTSIS